MRICVRAVLLLLFCEFQQSWLTGAIATGIPRALQSPKGQGGSFTFALWLQTCSFDVHTWTLGTSPDGWFLSFNVLHGAEATQVALVLPRHSKSSKAFTLLSPHLLDLHSWHHVVITYNPVPHRTKLCVNGRCTTLTLNRTAVAVPHQGALSTAHCTYNSAPPPQPPPAPAPPATTGPASVENQDTVRTGTWSAVLSRGGNGSAKGLTHTVGEVAPAGGAAGGGGEVGAGGGAAGGGAGASGRAGAGAAAAIDSCAQFLLGEGLQGGSSSSGDGPRIHDAELWGEELSEASINWLQATSCPSHLSVPWKLPVIDESMMEAMMGSEGSQAWHWSCLEVAGQLCEHVIVPCPSSGRSYDETSLQQTSIASAGLSTKSSFREAATRKFGFGAASIGRQLEELIQEEVGCGDIHKLYSSMIGLAVALIFVAILALALAFYVYYLRLKLKKFSDCGHASSSIGVIKTGVILAGASGITQDQSLHRSLNIQEPCLGPDPIRRLTSDEIGRFENNPAYTPKVEEASPSFLTLMTMNASPLHSSHSLAGMETPNATRLTPANRFSSQPQVELSSKTSLHSSRLTALKLINSLTPLETVQSIWRKKSSSLSSRNASQKSVRAPQTDNPLYSREHARQTGHSLPSLPLCHPPPACLQTQLSHSPATSLYYAPPPRASVKCWVDSSANLSAGDITRFPHPANSSGVAFRSLTTITETTSLSQSRNEPYLNPVNNGLLLSVKGTHLKPTPADKLRLGWLEGSSSSGETRRMAAGQLLEKVGSTSSTNSSSSTLSASFRSNSVNDSLGICEMLPSAFTQAPARHSVWNKNYMKPREISAAQDRLNVQLCKLPHTGPSPPPHATTTTTTVTSDGSGSSLLPSALNCEVLPFAFNLNGYLAGEVVQEQVHSPALVYCEGHNCHQPSQNQAPAPVDCKVSPGSLSQSRCSLYSMSQVRLHDVGPSSTTQDRRSPNSVSQDRLHDVGPSSTTQDRRSHNSVSQDRLHDVGPSHRTQARGCPNYLYLHDSVHSSNRKLSAHGSSLHKISLPHLERLLPLAPQSVLKYMESGGTGGGHESPSHLCTGYGDSAPLILIGSVNSNRLSSSFESERGAISNVRGKQMRSLLNLQAEPVNPSNPTSLYAGNQGHPHLSTSPHLTQLRMRPEVAKEPTEKLPGYISRMVMTGDSRSMPNGSFFLQSPTPAHFFTEAEDDEVGNSKSPQDEEACRRRSQYNPVHLESMYASSDDSQHMFLSSSPGGLKLGCRGLLMDPSMSNVLGACNASFNSNRTSMSPQAFSQHIPQYHPQYDQRVYSNGKRRARLNSHSVCANGPASANMPASRSRVPCNPSHSNLHPQSQRQQQQQQAQQQQAQQQQTQQQQAQQHQAQQQQPQQQQAQQQQPQQQQPQQQQPQQQQPQQQQAQQQHPQQQAQQFHTLQQQAQQFHTLQQQAQQFHTLQQAQPPQLRQRSGPVFSSGLMGWDSSSHRQCVPRPTIRSERISFLQAGQTRFQEGHRLYMYDGQDESQLCRSAHATAHRESLESMNPAVPYAGRSMPNIEEPASLGVPRMGGHVPRAYERHKLSRSSAMTMPQLDLGPPSLKSRRAQSSAFHGEDFYLKHDDFRQVSQAMASGSSRQGIHRGDTCGVAKMDRPQSSEMTVVTACDPILPGLRLDLKLHEEVQINTSENLGCGAYGTVYRGSYNSQPVAVKVPHMSVADENDLDGALTALLQEVTILSRVRHPNVVRFYGASITPPVFIVSELMHQDLGTLIHSRPSHLSLNEALRIGLDIIKGLFHLHPTIFHRDLKPANVLLDLQNNAMITDFGLARHPSASKEASSHPKPTSTHGPLSCGRC